MKDSRSTRKVREGVVVSVAMQKTAVVELQRLIRHPQYGKVVRLNKRVHVHDESGDCDIGDVVRIMETRPLSKLKRWRYVETIRKAVKV
ncbi:MAG: 30S ribosomal protein S17 [Candidatus Omnitrophota bacterium]|jgi:small subunit ribosomal protein S17|nr:MAG: 30S ribosomal protein S17 [Candidatus Omnitrophota bacterium]